MAFRRRRSRRRFGRRVVRRVFGRRRRGRVGKLRIGYRL